MNSEKITNMINNVIIVAGTEAAQKLYQILENKERLGQLFDASKVPNGRDSLWNYFVFSNTDDGHDYWANISRNLDKLNQKQKK